MIHLSVGPRRPLRGPIDGRAASSETIGSHHRAINYPLLGALLSLGAPLGLLIVRALSHGRLSLMGVESDIAGDPVTYTYIAASTMLVFVILGAVAGRTADRLELRSSTDGLTRLANRREFDAHLAARMATRPFPLTVSIGVADTKLAGAATAAAMQSAADAALYDAKTTGRDRVKVSARPNAYAR